MADKANTRKRRAPVDSGTVAGGMAKLFYVLVEEKKRQLTVPPGAWTVRQFCEKSGASITCAQKMHAKLVREGRLISGGVNNGWYWPA